MESIYSIYEELYQVVGQNLKNNPSCFSNLIDLSIGIKRQDLPKELRKNIMNDILEKYTKWESAETLNDKHRIINYDFIEMVTKLMNKKQEFYEISEIEYCILESLLRTCNFLNIDKLIGNLKALESIVRIVVDGSHY